MIRVMLCDDHAAFREPLAFMLEREPGIAVVAEAGSLAEARAHLVSADVALVDLHLADGSGIELINDLRVANPKCRILVVTASIGHLHIAEAVEAGADVLLNKSTPIREVIDMVRRLGKGEQLIPSHETIELIRLAVRRRERDRDARTILALLTPREREVLQALAAGLSDKEIADRLHVRAETVRTHMVRILGKLQVDSRLKALVFAIRYGAVSVSDQRPAVAHSRTEALF